MIMVRVFYLTAPSYKLARQPKKKKKNSKLEELKREPGSDYEEYSKMAVTFYNLNSESGLKKLDEYLLTRSYITGYQASKDDITVHAALSGAPSSEYVNVCRWYNHIDALLRLSGVSGEGRGVTIEGSASEEAIATPPIADTKAPVDEDDDDDDVDLFGEETEEEKKAAEERAAAVKASGKKKESGKSSVLLDIKPWDDETDMQKLEETVRSIQMEGLFWGASKLVPVGYGIKKLQIMMTIVDDLQTNTFRAVILWHSTKSRGLRFFLCIEEDEAAAIMKWLEQSWRAYIFIFYGR
ncbi:hypothetical protein NE237_025228 [Protea cynaroides]|uniref:Translation elongation factor EF1B beta/delta subunit guanine nucleotide exchange domain-containing protein n=1 Tax=Protea cynaroides TaxID=273540 RepID=A0A9Q0H1I7_9MAGN|nr:hypothetical protein NE237_025228 [Protea cynaroides]